MGTSALPDIYARSPRAAGLRVEGLATHQAKHECPCYN